MKKTILHTGLKIRFLIVFTSFFVLGKSYSQETRFIRYYNEGQYLKCLELADKTIDREKKNYHAILYKSLALARICVIKEFDVSQEYAAERALKTLIFLKKKDKTDTFIQSHAAEVTLILGNTFEKAARLAETGKLREAIRVYNLLAEFRPLPKYYYEKGKCQLNAGFVAEGGDNLINAARLIWQDYRDGKQPDSELEVIYTDLSGLLDQYNFKKEALVIMKRAALIFPGGNKVRNAYFKLLENRQENLNLFSSDSDYINQLMEIDTFGTLFPSAIEIQELRNSTSESYVKFLVYRRDENRLRSFINRKIRVSADAIDSNMFYTIEKLLKQSVFEYTKVNSDEVPVPGLISEFAAGTLVWLYHLKNPWANDEQVIRLLLSNSGEKNGMDKTAMLLVNYNELYRNSEIPARISQEFIRNLVNSSGNDLDSWKKILYWKKIFPENKMLSSKFLSLSKSLSGQFINSEKAFGKAWEILSEANKLYPKDPELKELSKNCGLADYMENYIGTSISISELNWNGNADKCNPGSFSLSAKNKMLKRLNYFRRMAGVPEIQAFDPALSRYAQQAAFVMSVNNMLSHYITSSWKCYSDSAAKGASNSNLSLGEFAADALTGQLEDGGEGNYFTGHRRWILHPFNTIFGAGSTTNSMALWCLPESLIYPDKQIEKYKKQFVAWPPAGVVPSPLVFERWSFSLFGADFSEAIVRMNTGQSQVIVTTEKIVGGHGLPTVVWVPQNLTIENNKEIVVNVIIENVLINETGERRRFEYIVNIEPVK